MDAVRTLSLLIKAVRRSTIAVTFFSVTAFCGLPPAHGTTSVLVQQKQQDRKKSEKLASELWASAFKAHGKARTAGDFRAAADLYERASWYFSPSRESKPEVYSGSGSPDTLFYYPLISASQCYFQAYLLSNEVLDLEQAARNLSSVVNFSYCVGGIRNGYASPLIGSWLAAMQLKLSFLKGGGSILETNDAAKSIRKLSEPSFLNKIYGTVDEAILGRTQELKSFVQANYTELRNRAIPIFEDVPASERWKSEDRIKQINLPIRVLGAAVVTVKVPGSADQTYNVNGTGVVPIEFVLEKNAGEAFISVTAASATFEDLKSGEMKLGPFMTIVPPDIRWDSSVRIADGTSGSSVLSVADALPGDRVVINAKGMTASPNVINVTAGEPTSFPVQFTGIEAFGSGTATIEITRTINGVPSPVSPKSPASLTMESKPIPIVSASGFYVSATGPKRGAVVLAVEDYRKPSVLIDDLEVVPLVGEGKDGRKRYTYVYPFTSEKRSISYEVSQGAGGQRIVRNLDQPTATTDFVEVTKWVPEYRSLLTDNLINSVDAFKKIKATQGSGLFQRIADVSWSEIDPQLADSKVLFSKDVTEVAGVLGKMAILITKRDKIAFSAEASIYRDARLQMDYVTVIAKDVKADASISKIKLGEVEIELKPSEQSVRGQSREVVLPAFLASGVTLVTVTLSDKDAQGTPRDRSATVVMAKKDAKPEIAILAAFQPVESLLLGKEAQGIMPDWAGKMALAKVGILRRTASDRVTDLAGTYSSDNESLLVAARKSLKDYVAVVKARNIEVPETLLPAALDAEIRERFSLHIEPKILVSAKDNKVVSGDVRLKTKVSKAMLSIVGADSTLTGKTVGTDELQFLIPAGEKLPNTTVIEIKASFTVAGVDIVKSLQYKPGIKSISTAKVSFNPSLDGGYIYRGETEPAIIMYKALLSRDLKFDPGAAKSLEWSLERRGETKPFAKGEWKAGAESKNVLALTDLKQVGRYTLRLKVWENADMNGDPAPQEQSITLLGQAVAFVFGQSRYQSFQNLPPLKFAAKDAKDFVQELINWGYDEAAIFSVVGESVYPNKDEPTNTKPKLSVTGIPYVVPTGKKGDLEQSIMTGQAKEAELDTNPEMVKDIFEKFKLRLQSAAARHAIVFASGHGSLDQFGKQVVYTGGYGTLSKDDLDIKFLIFPTLNLVSQAAERNGTDICTVLINDTCRSSTDGAFNNPNVQGSDFLQFYACGPREKASEPSESSQAGIANSYFTHAFLRDLEMARASGMVPNAVEFYDSVSSRLQLIVNGQQKMPKREEVQFPVKEKNAKILAIAEDRGPIHGPTSKALLLSINDAVFATREHLGLYLPRIFVP